mmetsp:Transcript_1429/g.3226  ORF Transcript_1429/g.3226 Transcript_1429/m.3226 type:complete len:172 (-) Transcript_1429:474-989(-)|eukprot:CAMPEP_0171403658 /NCGR_PEP_ID=MMETSP0880-20121228/11726_1 /TAXON_ID=67004 /ORGANISM="Thalassiosira weissflogii, Strain CCMP1336" /LENGTH=171 /DNA_ID=CAMNT_0011918671 /DNA_START=21 /DNA_END=536 /DNA_ORIENTATION=-
MKSIFTPFLVALALSSSAAAFSPVIPSRIVRTSSPCTRDSIQLLLSSPSDDDQQGTSPVADLPDDIPAPVNAASVTTESKAVAVEENTTSSSYPINLPSPILLSSSMVLAIAATGSFFELFGPNPKFGFGPTAAIAAIGLPSCLFLFYAAILKGMAETEEDDREYNKPRRL